MLPDAAQQLLRGAAVAGDPFDLDLAVAAAGLDDADMADAFDALLAAELVRDTEIPRRFRFRHPVARRAVYEAAPGGWRLAAHDRAAALLAARGATATARAHHVEFAAQHGDPASLAVLTEAGEAALLRAPAAAVRWLGAALRLLPADAEPASRGCGSCSPGPARSPRRGSSPRATPTCSRASAWRRPTRPRCACSSPRRARRSSGCSAATTTRARDCSPASRSSPSRTGPTPSR